jgi:hypothetical protein
MLLPGFAREENAGSRSWRLPGKDRVLDPDNGAATLDTLMRAARVVGRELHLRLV